MKKTALVFGLFIIFFSTTFAQLGFKTADYTAQIDSFTPKKVIDSVTVSCGGRLILIKDSARYETMQVRNKLKVIDSRMEIPAGTTGRVIATTFKEVQTTTPDPKADIGDDRMIITVFKQKVYWVSFDTKKGVAVVPFTAGMHPESNSPFNPDLSLGPDGAATAFIYQNHLYQVEGSATLQLDQKMIGSLRKASGNGF